MMGAMLRRLLCGPHPGPRARRVVPVILVCLVLAIYGTILVTLTPRISDSAGVRTLWVLFVVMLLKVPLIVVLWWLVARNPEWPGTQPRWGEDERREILAYLEAEAQRATGLPDAPARLAYLSREAWHVADRVEGDAKVDALTVALRIDTLAGRVRRERNPSG